jgi:UDP-N-acetylmuramyl pentapeptide phosphotransferase/UDP-N-acetylglucosamine-1-phosphate transferase
MVSVKLILKLINLVIVEHTMMYSLTHGAIASFTAFALALIIMLIHQAVVRNDPSLRLHRASHTRPTSRLGGVAVSAAVIVALTTAEISVKFDILICAVPIFLMGLSEDLHYHLKPKVRLTIASLSAAAFILFEGSRIQSIGLPFIDGVLSMSIISVLFTVFCFVALTNAINFIDGINGFASGKTLIVSGAIFLLSMQYGEPGIVVLSAAIFTATLGLFMLNYPYGRIFMGDAGAYTLGFLLAACLITLHYRHPEISPWAIILVIFWPIADMAHCILRRAVSGKNPQRADMLHMHHVVMRALTVRSNGRMKRHVANPLATAIILPISAIPVICGYVYRENNLICLGLTFSFFIAFCVAHVALVEKTKTRAHRIKEFTI